MIILKNDTFDKVVLENDKPVLVDFYADWCGPCQMLSPMLEDLAEDSDLHDKLTFAKINTEDYPELADAHGVQGIPCLIIFYKGKEHNRIVGYAPKPIMKTKITKIMETING